jgi:transposase-like protein
MNHHVDVTTGVVQDSTMAHSNHYNNDGWANMGTYSQSPYTQSPINEYDYNRFFMPQGMQPEQMNRISMPPAQPQLLSQTQHQHQHHQMIQPGPPPPPQPAHTSGPASHQTLPMLNTNTTWPSQLTNPSPGSFSAPPLSVTPLSSATPTEAPPRPPAQPEKARKTLSNEQKRAMCQYHQDHPHARQADIGQKFGVERSTVSKVLRQKDQYLKPDPELEQEQASGKRAKTKHPDFDRTLSNLLRRQQEQGFEFKDEEILERARMMAKVSGKQDSVLSTINLSWLQKFKQKHGVGSAGRLMRRASETNIPDSARMSTAMRVGSRKTGALGISPPSPSAQRSPVSATKSDEEAAADGLDYDFTYHHPEASLSTTSLSSDMRDTGNSSYSANTMSPTGPFTFSPDPNVGAFQMDHNLQMQPRTAADLQPREKRSNTFPSLNIDYVHQAMATAATEPMTPRQPVSATTTAVSSAIESPANDLNSASFGMDTAALTSPPTLRRTSSNSNIAGRAATPATNSAMSSASVDSSPVSPSPEDARRAANTLLNYIQGVGANGQFDQNEYLAVVQLTKKLQLHQHQLQLQPLRPAMGGLSRIPEGDGELPATTEVTMESN